MRVCNEEMLSPWHLYQRNQGHHFVCTMNSHSLWPLYINNDWEYDRSMNIRDILWEHAMNYFILLSPYVGNAVAMPSLLIRDSYVFNSANASSGVRVTCAPVRRDTGLRDPVCLISRWAQRTCSDICCLDETPLVPYLSSVDQMKMRDLRQKKSTCDGWRVNHLYTANRLWVFYLVELI